MSLLTLLGCVSAAPAASSPEQALVPEKSSHRCKTGGRFLGTTDLTLAEKYALICELQRVVDNRELSTHKRNYQVYSKCLDRTFWSFQILKWHDEAEEKEYARMFADPMLLKKYGNDWHKRRKQVPPEWMEFLAKETSGLDTKVKRKGKLKYVDLPGRHGEMGRRIIQQTLNDCDATRADDEHLSKMKRNPG